MDFNDVVCNKPMAALDKLKCTFRFTDTRMTCEQDADAVHLYQNTMESFFGCEYICKNSPASRGFVCKIAVMMPAPTSV